MMTLKLLFFTMQGMAHMIHWVDIYVQVKLDEQMMGYPLMM